MNTISFSAIEPIARRIRKARLQRRPIQLNTEQVALLDEWIQSELELQADAEWLARATISDERRDFISLDEVEYELKTGETLDDNLPS